MDAYVPVYAESGNTWYPSNDAARTLVQLTHVWHDIQKLNQLRLSIRETDKIADRLLLKYILVEFFSALDHARALQAILRQSPRLIVGQPAPFRYITKRELNHVTEVYKNLWRDLDPLQPLIAKIRNQIGAHRSAEVGKGVEELWEQLDAEKFVHLLNRIPEIIDAVHGINIFDWSWCDPAGPKEDGSLVMSMFGARIIHDWDHAFPAEETSSKLPQQAD